IENADLSYVYGTDAVELSSDEDKKVLLNIFSGADVKSLKFNTGSVNTLTQDKLDYLATLQWKDDIDFDETGLNKQSFSQFYQTLRVSVADNKENAAFTQGAQEAVTESLQNAYDKVTKVDKDNEMIELIKFQSAYEANAKMVTIVDEMLQTLLGMKR
ncbi:flagellar basal body rod C-terminal domain-containing protein, partial [Poseidonibacter sp.]|uniref:flagellar basal body rod C-terminal domain-containing protein n=1 Tax=Poseidonibacter sp. TaxID=2321188 RepID=UPI003C73ABCC